MFPTANNDILPNFFVKKKEGSQVFRILFFPFFSGIFRYQFSTVLQQKFSLEKQSLSKYTISYDKIYILK